MSILDSAFLKLQRAHQQLVELDVEIVDFCKSDPYDWVFDRESDRPYEVVRFVRVKEPNPVWGVRIGEVVHDLRSSLDHAVWELVILNGKSPVKRRTGFPVFDDSIAYHEGRKNRPAGILMLDGVHPRVEAFITSLQPYKALDHGLIPGQMTLSVLHDLWNTDKHRMLHVTPMYSELTEINFTWANVVLRDLWLAPSGEVKEGAEIARFRATGLPDGGTVEVKVNFAYQVTLGETAPPAAQDMNVVDLLATLTESVQDILNKLWIIGREVHEL